MPRGILTPDQRARQRAGIARAHAGRPLSAQHRRKISVAHLRLRAHVAARSAMQLLYRDATVALDRKMVLASRLSWERGG